jgi:hypothetical protein
MAVWWEGVEAISRSIVTQPPPSHWRRLTTLIGMPRQANPSYVIWTAAFNTTFLAGYLFVELLVFGAENKRQRRVVPPLMAAFNKNGLVLFLAVSVVFSSFCHDVILLPY